MIYINSATLADARLNLRLPRGGYEVSASCVIKKETAMQWVKPAWCDLRLGFEVTAYVYVR